MSSAILQKTTTHIASIRWLNTSFLRDSQAHRLEIDSPGEDTDCQGFSDWIFQLFEPYLGECFISNRGEWGDFCLWLDPDWESTNPSGYKHSASLIEGYQSMLTASLIEDAYAGDCTCTDWKVFLDLTVACVVDKLALYSPIIYSPALGIAFYYHYSYSIGFFYTDESPVASLILSQVQVLRAN